MLTRAVRLQSGSDCRTESIAKAAATKHCLQFQNGPSTRSMDFQCCPDNASERIDALTTSYALLHQPCRIKNALPVMTKSIQG